MPSHFLSFSKIIVIYSQHGKSTLLYEGTKTSENSKAEMKIRLKGTLGGYSKENTANSPSQTMMAH